MIECRVAGKARPLCSTPGPDMMIPAITTRTPRITSQTHQLMALAYDRSGGDPNRVFVARPRPTVQRILDFVGESPKSLPFENDRTVRLGRNHTVSGNPDRFKTGSVKLREDAEWAAKQPRGDRLVTTMLALPLLHRYGYRLDPS